MVNCFLLKVLTAITWDFPSCYHLLHSGWGGNYFNRDGKEGVEHNFQCKAANVSHNEVGFYWKQHMQKPG